MPSLSSGTPKETSPIEKLNEKLESNNSDISNILDRLTNVGARISVNHPESENPNKISGDSPVLPFNEGVLMEYLYKLNRQEALINQLRNQVVKLEVLF